MKENYYFDNAATTWPKPEPVYGFMDTFMRNHGVNPGRAGHQMAIEAEAMVGETRRMLAGFFGFGGDPNRVVFSLNATDSLNTAIYGLIQPGDHLIITRLEHNSVLRPANHLERDGDVSVTRIAPDGQGYVDPEDIRAALKPNTRAVIVNHASNVLGALQDVSAIGRIVAESDAAFIVDTCQTAGVVPIDMDDLGIDILVFTGHKGLFGPMGIGGMIVRDTVDIRPTRVGGTGVDSISSFQPDDYPFRLEAGTPSLPGIAGLNAAQKWFAALAQGDDKLSHADACRSGVEKIYAAESAHVNELVQAFNDIDSVKVYGPSGNGPRVATLSININDHPADQIGAMLDADFELCVRAGLHCAPLVHRDQGTVEQNGAVRFSPGYFTDEEDIARAIEGVSTLAGAMAR
jgi:cysteine desulfurase / selenocysteine lyase